MHILNSVSIPYPSPGLTCIIPPLGKLLSLQTVLRLSIQLISSYSPASHTVHLLQTLSLPSSHIDTSYSLFLQDKQSLQIIFTSFVQVDY